MKTLVIIALTVICYLCHSSTGQRATQIIMSGGCCSANTTHRIPIGRITHMGWSPDNCELKSLIITTVCNKRICVDSKSSWVKSTFAKFQKSTANNKPASAPFNVKKCEDKHQ